ncbi:hypothetical protein QMK19_29280 [Streptomyces sp. H10-C2]|uniref:hypothetical protein n=1 Tax=Streptomyces TaxID=1883 RepID=UPI0018DF0C74|nr:MULTISPECIES: hypothetical protein [Streptomyces]MDJ0344213.1 hypothetical protein [Streptomyces sp. PH10-H1]MDJ0373643.1 hypothetical protein [Streptomyces sp. H10-C2]
MKGKTKLLAPTQDRCDLCGRLIDPNTARYGAARDSSVIHNRDPQMDGKRLLIACDAEHMTTLWNQYQQRPYSEPELWAGKMQRVLRDHRRGLDQAAMERATGLTAEQITAAFLWNNARALAGTFRPPDPT